MRALVLEQFDTPLVARDLDVPEPGEGQVLVRVEASGVNPLDTKIRAGKAGHAQSRLPAVLGLDLAGVVEQVGPGVTAFAPGDEVYGLTGGVGDLPGSLAEYAAVDARLLARKPANLTFREAAALPLAAITAWEGLVDRAGVHAGQKVLIHGGAGGVGQAAVQIAKARGADVYATGSQRSLDAIRDLGATPVDYASEPVEQYVNKHTDGEGFDVVFDTVGGPTLDASFAAVRVYTGHVVSALGWGTHSLAPLSFRGATYSGVFTLMPMLTGGGSGSSREHHGEILREVTELAEAGLLKPRLDGHVFALTEADIAKAHALAESGESDGKVVVTVRE